MKPLAIDALARILGTQIAAAVAANGAPVTGVCTDSRAVTPGDCFFALAGEHFDGHQYVATALDQGAVCAVVEAKADRTWPVEAPVITVADTVRALGDLARHYRRSHPYKIVAITGSVGKTTTRQIVSHALSRRFRVHQAQRNFNNHIGLPLTLLAAAPDDEVIVAELGANHPGEIGYLTGIAGPDVAMVTNVYPAHLEGFGDLETITAEKISIADGLAEDGVFVVNGDIESLVTACRAGKRPFRTFGSAAGLDIRAEQIEYEGLSSTFTIHGTRIMLPLPGPGNVENATAAWAACETLGLTIEEFAAALATLPAVAMRAEPLEIGTLTVLNDCYNANPASMRNALATLAQLRPSGPDATQRRRLVFVCGAMAELGAASETLHAELGEAVAAAGVDLLLTVGEPTRLTARRARETASHELQTRCFDDTLAVCSNLQALIKEYDIILVKGSRTARLEQVVESLRRRLESVRDRETG